MITLLICAFLIPVILAMVKIIARNLSVPEDFQDEVSIAQLRHVINVSREFECHGNELSFLHHEERQRLVLRNGNLVLVSPGTQIFLTELEQASFFTEGDLIYVSYRHVSSQEAAIRCIGRL